MAITTSIPQIIVTPEDSIKSLRLNILDKSMLIFVIAMLCSTPFSVSRALHTGIQMAYIVQTILVVVLSVIVWNRNQIPYIYKAISFVFIMIFVGATGLYSFGMIGQGPIFLACAAIFSSVFFNKRSSYVLLGVNLAIIITAAILFTMGLTKTNFSSELYTKSIASWITLFIAVALFTSLLVLIISDLFRDLHELLHEKSERIAKMDTLNKEFGARLIDLERERLQKDRILGVVSHDINNKLSSILAYLDILTEDLSELDRSKIIEYANSAHESAINAKDCVKDILEIAGDSVKEGHITTELVNMYDFIQSTIDGYKLRASEKKIELSIVRPNRKVFCRINKTKMSRVIDNLMTNSLKFTNSGGKIYFEIEPEEAGTIIRIVDSGTGIPEELQANIFKPLPPSNSEGTSSEQSIGLGLSIVKEIVELHGGKIWFESEVGQGTTFNLYLENPKFKERRAVEAILA